MIDDNAGMRRPSYILDPAACCVSAPQSIAHYQTPAWYVSSAPSRAKCLENIERIGAHLVDDIIYRPNQFRRCVDAVLRMHVIMVNRPLVRQVMPSIHIGVHSTTTQSRRRPAQLHFDRFATGT